MVLKKELALYERDEEGILIPQETEMEMSKRDKGLYPDLVGQTIRVIPMTRGDIKKMFSLGGKDTDVKPDTTKDEDGEIIVKYCKDPQFTMEELAVAKPIIVRSITRTIFSESGIKVDDKAGTKRFDQNDKFGKNSSESNENVKKDV